MLIVPTAEVGYVPFEALIESFAPDGTPRYVTQSHVVRYAPSLSVLRVLREARQADLSGRVTIWAWGNPAGDVQRGLLPLAEVGAELAAMAARLRVSADHMLLGERAIRQRLLEMSSQGTLERCRYVHFACHGIAAGEGIRSPRCSWPESMQITPAG